jgi:hypothetical protein
MFITKRHIPRRTFLRGMGVTLALPFLDAMLPAQTPLRQTAASPKTRFTGVWIPHGAAPGYFSPATEGTDFKFSVITAPLESFRDRVVIVSGLNATSSAATPEEPGADHQRSAAFLSGVRPKKDTVVPSVGTTIDQMIAQQIGQDTLMPSIEFGIEDNGANTGVCNFGYSCAYTNTISWQTPTKSLPVQINPRLVFERLFGDGSTPEERLAGRQMDRSILDSITRDLSRLQNKIGPTDRTRLDNFLEDIREIERRLQIAAKVSAEAPTSSVPFGVPESFGEHIRLMFDLNLLAFQADITRVSTLMFARDLSGRRYPECGFDGSFHAVSHHDEDPGIVRNLAKINTYHVECLAYFLDKLRATPDADGNLLDHSLIYYGSNMGNSNRHTHEMVPTILAGGASGWLKGGRHLVFRDDKERTSNLLLSILDAYGIHPESVGDSTGHLPI